MSGRFHMRKLRKEMEEKHGRFLDCQQQLSHPDRSSESFHCIPTTNPTRCLEKQREDLPEIYIGIFMGCMGTTRPLAKLLIQFCVFLHIENEPASLDSALLCVLACLVPIHLSSNCKHTLRFLNAECSIFLLLTSAATL